MRKLLFMISIVLFMTNCSISEGTTENATITGVFADDPVEGLGYLCSSGRSGTTDSVGQYTCSTGDNVTFSLANVILGTAVAQSGMVTPYTLFPNDVAAAINVARLLQSMDNNLSDNIITFDSDMAALLAVDTNFSSPAFATDTQNYLNITLISAEQAQKVMNNYIINNGGTLDINNTIPNNNSSPSASFSSLSVSKETLFNGVLTGSDTDGDRLSFRVNSNPSYGTLSLDGNGTFSYIANNNFFGSDTFDYNVSDGVDSVSQTVSINVFSSFIINIDENDSEASISVLTDPNALYSISGGDSASFNIDPSSGIVTFKEGLNYRTKTLYAFTATARASDGSLRDTEVTINMNNLNATTPFGVYYSIPTTISYSDAHRFLNRATFGASAESIAELQTKGYIKWIEDQLNYKSPHDLFGDDMPIRFEKFVSNFKKAFSSQNTASVESYMDWNNSVFNVKLNVYVKEFQTANWFEFAITSPDQLRQRMAHALSQIIVISKEHTLFQEHGEAVISMMDLMSKHAFGNYRDLLGKTSIEPGMGVYLTHSGNKKASATTFPDENFAREVIQLFSVGLFERNIDGSPILDADENMIPTYNQDDISELARVFTGWDTQSNFDYGYANGDLHRSMEFTAQYHDFDAKQVMGIEIPAELDGQEDLDAALDVLFSQDSVAPYISELLIQRLTTSNPSSAYISRVATVFNDDGTGVKGNLSTVLKAILLDPDMFELSTADDFKKAKEPLLALTQLYRTFNIFNPNIFDSNEGKVPSMFWIDDTQSYIRQSPMGAPNVFGFFNVDYIPNDPWFVENKMKAPEFELITPQQIIGMSNYYYLLGLSATTIDSPDYDSPDYEPIFYGNRDRTGIILDYSEEYEIMDRVSDGVLDGNYSAMYMNPEVMRDVATELVNHLNIKLTGGEMTTQHITDTIEVATYQFPTREPSHFYFPGQLRGIIADIIKNITVSDAYIIQR